MLGAGSYTYRSYRLQATGRRAVIGSESESESERCECESESESSVRVRVRVREV